MRWSISALITVASFLGLTFNFNASAEEPTQAIRREPSRLSNRLVQARQVTSYHARSPSRLEKFLSKRSS